MERTFKIIKKYPDSRELGYRFTLKQEEISNNALYLKYPEFFKEITEEKKSIIREFKANQWLYATQGDEEILLRYNGVNSFNAIITEEYYWLKSNKLKSQGSSAIGIIQQELCMVATEEQFDHVMKIAKYPNLSYFDRVIDFLHSMPVKEQDNFCKGLCIKYHI